jgi:hypothetical protein
MLLCFSQAASDMLHVSNFFSSETRKSWLRISLPPLKRITVRFAGSSRDAGNFIDEIKSGSYLDCFGVHLRCKEVAASLSAAKSKKIETLIKLVV